MASGKQKLRILVVEDSESDTALLVRHLERAGYEVDSRRVETEQELEEALENAEWDLVLSDNNLPQLDAKTALEIFLLRQKDIPFIIVSNAIGDEAAVALLKAGAHDYLLKDKLARLVSVIERERAEAMNREQARQQNEQIRSLSHQLMHLAEIERAEIASELHDSIGQSLVLLKLNLIKFLQENNLRTSKNEAILVNPVTTLLNELRGISRRLTPSHMKKVGLQLAIEDMLSTASEMSGVQVVTDLRALDGFFPDNWSIACFRIIQEAVTNALKHSGASEIRVLTRNDGGNLEIQVSDNGKGPAGTENSKGIGLALMNERLKGMQGQLNLAGDGSGFTVRIRIPADAFESVIT